MNSPLCGKRKMEMISKIILVLVSLFFGILAFLWIGPTATISELDDIRVIELIAFPSILISSGISVWLVILGYRKMFLFPGMVNTISAIAALVGCSSGVIDILKLQNRIYNGHQGNNYHSFDLFVVALVPVICVIFSWSFYYYKRPSNIKQKTT